MTLDARSHAADLRGLARLAVEATCGVTHVVDDMHRAIAGPPLPVIEPARRLVYRQIRGVAGVIGAGLDLTLAGLGPLLAQSTPGVQRDALQAAINGVLGDHLEATANPLAIEMALRVAGRRLPVRDPARLARAVPGARPRLLVMVHGSCMADRQWLRRGHDHGAALAADLDASAVYLHYNSGCHVSTNGERFAALLDQLVAAWPVPVAEVICVGYSMGGLIVRSACHHAEAAGLAWRDRLRALAFVGTPHHGAPLERAGNWIDALLGVTRYSAPLGRLARIRSAGIADLRFGSLLEADWGDRDRFALGVDRRRPVPLPAVDCFTLAGQLSTGRLGDLRGDGLVPVSSALGHHPSRGLGIPAERQHVVPGVAHLDLLCDPRVYATLRGWLAG